MNTLRLLPTDGQLEIKKMVIRAPNGSTIIAIGELQLDKLKVEIVKNGRQTEVKALLKEDINWQPADTKDEN